MFLLIRKTFCYSTEPSCEFTFHYVSINTKMISLYSGTPGRFTFHYVSINTYWANLICGHPLEFTFHYVSINTYEGVFEFEVDSKFTFHYVSINTFLRPMFIHSSVFIYIPLCFY